MTPNAEQANEGNLQICYGSAGEAGDKNLQRTLANWALVKTAGRGNDEDF